MFGRHRLAFPFCATFLLWLSPAVRPAELTGEGVSGNWQSDAPGVRHHISTEDLPKPYATPSAQNGPNVVAGPEGAVPLVPAAFEIRRYASGFRNPRKLLTAPNGDIFVAESEADEIRILRESKHDGKPDINRVFLSGLNKPFGLALYPPGDHPQYLYIGNTDGVVRVPYQTGDLEARGKTEHITDLSGGGRLRGGGHWTRDVTFSLDGKKLFASVGSLTNVDQDSAPVENDRARIFVMNPDGSDKQPFATGIRNPVGLAIHPDTGDLWASVNERDELGDDLVCDYITRVRENQFFGWPWFYLGNHPDPRHAKDPHAELADKVTVPDVLLQSHSASLNLVFYTGANFPAEYRHDAFAAFHGSWNRKDRTGYKVIRVPLKDGQPQGVYEDFITGFVLPDGTVWGRPVGLTVMKDGGLLMSEDGNKTLWKVTAAGK
ncbi:MAG TPA: PQQ-dependent sugar dehydrogenase [Chthoniobacteraceae bacterium]